MSGTCESKMSLKHPGLYHYMYSIISTEPLHAIKNTFIYQEYKLLIYTHVMLQWSCNSYYNSCTYMYLFL